MKSIEEIQADVLKSVEEGYPFKYTLKTYVSPEKWKNVLSEALDFCEVQDQTDFEKERCLTFLISIKDRTKKTNEELMLKISTIDLCAIIEKRSYEGDFPLENNYIIMDSFEDKKLESVVLLIQELLENGKISLVTKELLDEPLEGVKVNGVLRSTYYNYAFGRE